MRIKYRYIVSALIIIASILLTPVCIDAAYQFRGYKAYGGEYIVLPLGLMSAVVFLELAKEWDAYISRKRREEKRRRMIKNVTLGK